MELTLDDQIDPVKKISHRYKIQKLKKSLNIISKYPTKITNGLELKNIPGIGKGTINRINEIIKTGTLVEIASYDDIIKTHETESKIIHNLMEVIGIGHATAIKLIRTYKIKSVDDLKKLSDSEQIKLNSKLKLGLKYLGKFQGMIPRSEIDHIYTVLQNITDQFDSSMFITICGSYRRELPTSSDIDVLLTGTNLINDDLDSNILSSYVKCLHDHNFLLDDITNKNIQTKYMGFCKYKSNSIRRIDIRLIPISSYFPALMYFTGSYEFNQMIRAHAKKLGYKLNEYGLYKLDDLSPITILSEQDIFKILQMHYIEPNLR